MSDYMDLRAVRPHEGELKRAHDFGAYHFKFGICKRVAYANS